MAGCSPSRGIDFSPDRADNGLVAWWRCSTGRTGGSPTGIRGGSRWGPVAAFTGPRLRGPGRRGPGGRKFSILSRHLRWGILKRRLAPLVPRGLPGRFRVHIRMIKDELHP